jgi:hypothetical protein
MAAALIFLNAAEVFSRGLASPDYQLGRVAPRLPLQDLCAAARLSRLSLPP